MIVDQLKRPLRDLRISVLWTNYPGQHVAIYQGQLVDRDEDGAAL